MDGEPQQAAAREDARGERDAEGEQTEQEATAAAAPQVRHVEVEPREEHDVEQARRAREYDAAVAQHEVEPVGADDGAGDDEPEQVRHLELVEQDRRREDDRHDEQELEDGVLQRQGDLRAGEGCDGGYGSGERRHGAWVLVQQR